MHLKKISTAEAMWMFKVVEQGHSLRSCNGVPKLFQTLSVTVILLKNLLCQGKMHCMLPLMGLDFFLGRDCAMILLHLRGRSQNV